MSIVNFSIPESLEQRIREVMAQKGFVSKAEFFRFAAIYFIDIVDKPKIDEEKRFDFLAEMLSKKVSEKYRNKDLPSVEDQLADV